MKDFSQETIGFLFLLLYFFGFYKIVVDDHRYTTKDVIIAIVVPPYPWWVGGKEIYNKITKTSKEIRDEERCLDGLEALGMPQKPRLRICECVIETKDAEYCKSKIIR